MSNFEIFGPLQMKGLGFLYSIACRRVRTRPRAVLQSTLFSMLRMRAETPGINRSFTLSALCSRTPFQEYNPSLVLSAHSRGESTRIVSTAPKIFRKEIVDGGACFFLFFFVSHHIKGERTKLSKAMRTRRAKLSREL